MVALSIFGTRTSSFCIGTPPFTETGAWREHLIAACPSITDDAAIPDTSKFIAYGMPSDDRNVGPSAIWKCTCGSVELPEFPSSAMTWPRLTRSPTLTRNDPG